METHQTLTQIRPTFLQTRLVGMKTRVVMVHTMVRLMEVEGNLHHRAVEDTEVVVQVVVDLIDQKTMRMLPLLTHHHGLRTCLRSRVRLCPC